MILHKVIIGTILVCAFSSAIAQNGIEKNTSEAKEVRSEIETAFGYGSLSRVLDVIYQLPSERRFLFFSLKIETDAKGQVENVDFTNKLKMIDSISFYQKVEKYFKDDKNKVFRKHKNAIYVVPVLLRSDDSYTIHVTQDFLKSFENLVPFISSDKIKSLTILPVLNLSLRSQK